MTLIREFNVKNVAGTTINPATTEDITALPQKIDEGSNWMLRRIMKMLDSLQTVDASNRQRVAVETSCAISTTIAAGTIGNAVGTVRLEQAGGFGSLWMVDQRWQIIDQARTAYATGIRPNLVFS